MSHRALPTNSAPSHLSAQLSRVINGFRLSEIASFCRECGLPVAGTKDTLSRSLVSAMTEHCFSTPRRPLQIVSLDLGLKNFAKSTITLHPTRDKGERPKLVAWEKVSLNLPKVYHPRQNAQILRSFSESIVRDDLVGADRVILVEKQTFRGGGLCMIPGDIIALNRVELQLHCFLLDHRVESIEPRSVASLFGFRGSKNKKREAVEILTAWLEDDKGSPIEVPGELRAVFLAAEKKDDFADSLLQGLAYITWRNNLASLLDRLQSKIGNRAV